MQFKATDFGLSTKVILLGISSYHNSFFTNLSSPASDAAKLTNIFLDPNAGNIVKENLTSIDQFTTKGDFLATLEEIIAASKEEESLIFFFAGHGLIEGNTFYFCLSDTDEKNLDGTAISSLELDRLLKEFRGRGLLLVLDCCRSAGFAELAPSFFSSLNRKDYKILLSASRTEQNSWELENEKGTLFTKHLARVLAGDVQVSESPGLVYFSELFNYLASQIDEELTVKYPDAPKQDVVFTGVFNKDPLLFVNRDLTLKQISVKTTRYSQEYINRLITKSSLLVLSVTLFALGVLYAFLEKSQFAVEVENNIKIYQGLPGIHALGFPKELWTLSLSVNDLSKDSKMRQGQALTSRLNHPILPEVIKEAKLHKQAEFLSALHDKAGARKRIMMGLVRAQQDDSVDVVSLLKTLKHLVAPADSMILAAIIRSNDNRYSILEKRQALGCLAKINLPEAAGLAFEWKINPNEEYSNHKEIVLNLAHSSRADVRRYLNLLLKAGYLPYLIPSIFELSIQYRVPLSVSDVATLIRGTQYPEGDGLGYNMRLFNSEQVKRYLQTVVTQDKASAPAEKPDWEAVRFAITALGAYDHKVEICDELYAYAVQGYSDESMRLVLRQCPAIRAQLIHSKAFLAATFKLAPDIILELAKQHLIDKAFISNAFQQLPTPYHRKILIRSFEALGDTSVAPVLLSQIPFSNSDALPLLRVASIKALQSLGIKYKRAANAMPYNWKDVTVEALKWQSDTEPEKVFERLGELLAKKDALSTILRVLSYRAPTEKLLNVARQQLNGVGEVKTNAVGVIAMFGNAAEVMTLLSSPDVSTRKETADLVSYNHNFNTILALANKRNSVFPNEAFASLQSDALVINEFDYLLKGLPSSKEARSWAASLLTSKYEDELSDGARLRIGNYVLE